ncbi:MAG: NUDIX hydrolase [Desulfomonilaceae bacterium]
MNTVSREYPTRPLIGVGAIIIKGPSVLLVRRSNPPAQGAWSIPGGLVRVGETLLQAVAREAFEETGLAIKAGPLVDLVERIICDDYNRVKYHYVIADYRCVATGGVPVAGSDASEVSWAKKHDLGSFNLPEIALNVIDKAFLVR